MLLKELNIRVDAAGDGHFGSKRSKKIGSEYQSYLHEGVDYLVKENEPVFAPENGNLVRIRYPYGSDLRWKGFEFQGDSGLNYKVFYVEPLDHLIGKKLEANSTIGYAQAISKKYINSAMQDHAHVEIRKNSVKGPLVDPTTILKKKANFQ